jgi:aerobic carbon-monoxide dehydrogenase small subunit
VIEPGDQVTVTLRVNGAQFSGPAEARLLLSDFLRHRLRLTGTHVGCEHGVCGACTVLIDGQPTRSCLTFAVQAEGTDITTVEGLASADGELHPVQQAFHEHHAMQCGFCTPGFLISLAAALDANPDPDDEELLEALSGNLCRCTGYANILAAARRARERMR